MEGCSHKQVQTDRIFRAGETEKLNNKTRHKICIKRAQEHNNGADASINTKRERFFFSYSLSLSISCLRHPSTPPPTIQNWCTPCPTDSAVHQWEIYILACETPPCLHPNLDEIQSSVRQSGGEECVCAACAFVNLAPASSTDIKMYNIWRAEQEGGLWTRCCSAVGILFIDLLSCAKSMCRRSLKQRGSDYCSAGYVHLVLLMCDGTICWVHSVCGAERFFFPAYGITGL